MIVGIMEVDFIIHDSFSLKDKRRLLKSLLEKTKSKFNVSIAEVANNDIHNLATLGLAVVSNSSRFIDESFDKILSFWERGFQIEIIETRREQL